MHLVVIKSHHPYSVFLVYFYVLHAKRDRIRAGMQGEREGSATTAMTLNV